MLLLFKMAWRNIWRNKKRSLITIVSVTAAVFLAIFMRSMQLGMYSNMIQNVVGSYTGYVQVHKQGYWEEQSLDNSLIMSQSLVDEIKKTKDVDAIIQRLQVFSLSSSGDKTKGVMIQGINMEDENKMTDWSNRLKEGELLEQGDQSIVVAKGVAEYFNKSVGDTLIFIGQGYHGMSAVGQYPIKGIIDLKNPKLNNLSVFMPIGLAQSFLSAEDLVTHLIIHKAEGADDIEIFHSLQNNLDATEYEVMHWHEMMPELQQIIAVDSIGGLLMIFVLYMIISFGIFGTILMMTQERKYELGVMVSVGMKKLKLGTLLILEGLLLSLVGIIAGIIAISPIRYYFYYNPIILPGDQGEAIEKFGFEAKIPLSIDWDIPLTHGGLIFIISMIISLYPLWVVWKLNPIDAMKQ